MQLSSPKTNVNYPRETLFGKLSDVRNFEKIMPDSLEKFEILGEDHFVFSLKGMPEIELKITEKVPGEKLVFASAEGKIKFTLTAFLEPAQNQKTDVQLVFNGQFNTMMAMMIKTPITNFINNLTRNLQKDKI